MKFFLLFGFCLWSQTLAETDSPSANPISLTRKVPTAQPTFTQTGGGPTFYTVTKPPTAMPTLAQTPPTTGSGPTKVPAGPTAYPTDRPPITFVPTGGGPTITPIFYLPTPSPTPNPTPQTSGSGPTDVLPGG